MWKSKSGVSEPRFGRKSLKILLLLIACSGFFSKAAPASPLPPIVHSCSDGSTRFGPVNANASELCSKDDPAAQQVFHTCPDGSYHLGPINKSTAEICERDRFDRKSRDSANEIVSPAVGLETEDEYVYEPGMSKPRAS